MTAKTDSVTTKQENVTTSERDSLARAGSLRLGVTLSRVTTVDRDVTSGRDSDRPPVGGSVTVTPEPVDAVVATVTPWPQYDDNGRGPFWSIRVQGQGFATTVSLAAHLGRFVYGASMHSVVRRRGARQALRNVACSLSPLFRQRIEQGAWL